MLTTENYFTIKNRYLSNSKIKDYLRDKNYFYRKHIKGEITTPITDSMIIGKAVDTWLTDSKEAFLKKYVAVSRRNLKNPPEDYTELNISTHRKVNDMCQAVVNNDAYKDLRWYATQDILTMDYPINNDWKGLCGIPDWYKVDGTNCIIVDLKTAQTITPKKFHYKCLDFGYYRQQAMYQILLKHKYPQIKHFESRILAVENSTNDVYLTNLFILDQARIEKEQTKIYEIIEDISAQEDYEPQNLKWSDAVTIGEITELSDEI